MRVSLNQVLYRSALSRVGRVERDQMEHLWYIKGQEDRSASGQRPSKKAAHQNPEGERAVLTPAEELASTLTELELASLPVVSAADEPPRHAEGPDMVTRAYSED